MALVSVLAVWSPARAAEPMPPRYVPALERMFEASRAPGMVAAVIDGDRVHVKGFGRTSAKNTATPDANTLLRLNSLSKLMAGEVLARMVSTGGISLDATLQQRAPSHRGAHAHTMLLPSCHPAAGQGPFSLVLGSQI